MNLSTDAELADLLKLTTEEVRRFCRERDWPHVRPKRSVWLFTDAQVEQIVVMQSKAHQPRRDPGRSAGRLPGQTDRSAARSRSG